jgi:hypothetical protein
MWRCKSMATKQKRLRIPSPCQVGWDNMQPDTQGRYCSSCDKVVVDFTTQTPAQIAAYYQAHSQQRICGHFRASQVNALYSFETQETKPGWRRPAGIALAALALLAAQPLQASPVLQVPTAQSNVTGTPSILPTAGKPITLRGTVYDPNGKPLADVEIKVLHVSTDTLLATTRTDKEGHFTVKLPEGTQVGELSLLAYSLIWESFWYPLSQYDAAAGAPIVLKFAGYEPFIDGDMVMEQDTTGGGD